ncbi:Bug family tripartite tricarboxylate transporter substrate binding protein [Roseomonas sp. BN140053]|uniref:Bug family tripartite tricarboxylate transporter substrate binding protein n=1 Tax=Roseomonas sp. BN140053 TaxID=3391898 RepID=UPI0039E97771
MNRRSILAAGASLGLLPLSGRSARAQEWPSRPVQLVVPSSPGGSLDTLARLLSEGLRTPLGQTVVVENRAGAAGAIGADYIAKSPPDGTRFLFGAVHHAILPAVQHVPYDSANDLTPVTGIGGSPNALLVPPSLPARSMPELVSWMRAQPAGSLTYATGGPGGLHHLTGAMFARALGIEMTAVHYRGSAPAINDLVAGRTTLMFETLPSAAGQIRGGALRALAVTSAARSPAFPDLPTMTEAGFPNIQMETWYGLFGPKNTPDAIVQRLRGAVAEVLATPTIQAAWTQNGVAGGGEPVATFTAFWRNELTRWASLAREAGMERE